MASPTPQDLVIRLYQSDAEARAAADIMANTEPWITLGRTAAQTYRNVTLPQQESYVAITDNHVVGIVIVAMPIPLIKGYINALAVHPDFRNRGIGTRLLTFAEQRIFRDSPNVFLCVSSFNPDAQRFYQRLGYHRIGELTDFAIPNHSEILLRKTTGPWSTFEAARQPR